MNDLEVFFTPADSLLFKPALLPDGMGARLLASDFPPPRRTLIGALRSAIGESLGVHWAEYRQGNAPDIDQAIGAPTAVLPQGASVHGPWLSKGGKRLMPLPLCFLAREKATDHQHKPPLDVAMLQPSDECYSTDLGETRLPVLPQQHAGKGFKARTDIWITTDGLQKISKVSQGESVELAPDDYWRLDELYVHDERLGIGMNSQQRRVEPGLLYQTRHVRLQPDVALMLRVKKWPAASKADGQVITLGADGRLASIHVRAVTGDEAVLQHKVRGTLWVTTAPLPMGEKGIPWALQDADLICAAIGKPMRHGGWSLKAHRSEPVRYFTPAGSAFWLSHESELSSNPDLICVY